MAPATCGAGMEVPLSVAVAVAPVCQAEPMLTPGACRSTQEPVSDQAGTRSVGPVAASVITAARRAGDSRHADVPEFPAGITTV